MDEPANAWVLTTHDTLFKVLHLNKVVWSERGELLQLWRLAEMEDMSMHLSTLPSCVIIKTAIFRCTVAFCVPLLQRTPNNSSEAAEKGNLGV